MSMLTEVYGLPHRTLSDLRRNGWRVAVHNDYTLNGSDRTFWLLTHPNGVYIKGEGPTDMDALMECDRQARQIFAPSP